MWNKYIKMLKYSEKFQYPSKNCGNFGPEIGHIGTKGKR
jgi:hypothetical protein